MMTVLLNRLPYKKAPYDQWLGEKISQIVLLTSMETASDFENLGFREIYAFEHYEDSLAVEEKVIQLHEKAGVNQLLFLSEYDVLRAGKLRSLLGIKGQDFFESAVFRDKLLMKQAARKVGLHVPVFSELHSKEKITSFSQKVGFPVVIKPVAESGSEGVHILREEKEVRQVIPQLSFDGKNEIEQFIEGIMYHVDGLFDGAKICFHSISKYHRGCLEFQENRPLFSYILPKTDALYTLLTEKMSQLIVPLMAGFIASFHIEFIVTKEGDVYLCEVASRTGGSLIARTIHEKYGVLLNERLLQLQLGILKDISLAEKEGIFGFLIFPPKKGKLLAFQEKEKILQQFLYVENFATCGTVYKEGTNSVDTLLAGVLQAQDETSLIQKFEKIVEELNHSLIYEEDVR